MDVQAAWRESSVGIASAIMAFEMARKRYRPAAIDVGTWILRDAYIRTSGPGINS